MNISYVIAIFFAIALPYLSMLSEQLTLVQKSINLVETKGVIPPEPPLGLAFSSNIGKIMDIEVSRTLLGPSALPHQTLTF